MTYTEFPTDLIVNVHWKKKDEPPPDPDGDDCLGGTWSYTVDYALGGVSLLEIHDAMTVARTGLPGDRSFSSPPYLDFFRVVGPQIVEFGPPGLYPTPYEKNLYGRSLARPGSVLRIEGTTVPGTESGPPPVPPSPFWPGGWIPKFVYGDSGTPTLSFSASEQYSIMPAYPDHSFMDRTGSWSYTYKLYGPSPPSYPCFDPDLAAGAGVFYLTIEGGGVTFSSQYQEWWNYYYGGGGGARPPWFGDQFYSNDSSGGSFSLKLTQVCGPYSP
jgi:hypothetical protein